MSIKEGSFQYLCINGNPHTGDVEMSKHAVIRDKYQLPDPGWFSNIGSSTEYDDEYKNTGFGSNIYNWIEMHDSSIQDAIKEVARAIKYIPMSEMTAGLIESHQDITNKISRLYNSEKMEFSENEHLITLLEGGKSNTWAANIVYVENKQAPFAYLRLGSKGACAFREHMNSIPISILGSVKNAFENKTIVLYDDASYSGQQITEHVENILEIIAEYNLKVKAIAVVIPYMTQKAHDMLVGIQKRQIERKNEEDKQVEINAKDDKGYRDSSSSSAEDEYLVVEEGATQEASSEGPVKSTTPILFSAFKLIPMITDLSQATQTTISDIWYKNTAISFKQVGLIYGWAGKVANAESFPAAIAKGSIYSKEGDPQKKHIQIIPDNNPCYKRIEKTTEVFIQNFHKALPGVYRGAVISKEGNLLKLKEQYKIQWIIDLKNKENSLVSKINELGMAYSNIKFDPNFNPQNVSSKNAVLSIIGAVICTVANAQKNKKRVFIHCQHGSDRTGLVIAVLKIYLKTRRNEALFEEEKNKELKEMISDKYNFHKINHFNMIEFLRDLKFSQMIEAVEREKENLSPCA